ncbi:MAG: hypothetical protein ABIM40_00795 [Pseudomonadota bacterium]
MNRTLRGRMGRAEAKAGVGKAKPPHILVDYWDYRTGPKPEGEPYYLFGSHPVVMGPDGEIIHVNVDEDGEVIPAMEGRA